MTMRRFDGVDDRVATALGSLGFAFGPGTIVAICRIRYGTNIKALIKAGTSATSGRYEFLIGTGSTNFLRAQVGSTAVTAPNLKLNPADGLALVAIRKQSGTVPVRYSKYAFAEGIMYHENSSTNVGNSGVPGSSAQIANGSGVSVYDGDIAILGVSNAYLTDEQIESLVAARANWDTVGFVALWELNQASTADPVLDLIGDADQTTLVGTEVLAEDVPYGSSGTDLPKYRSDDVGQAESPPIDDSQTITVPSIPSGEQFGTPTVVPGEVTITVPSIASQEAFGTPTIEHLVPDEQVITVPSIPSGESFGAVVVEPGEIVISVPSIASAEQFSIPALAQSGGPQTINMPSIASAEAFGAHHVILGGAPQTITMPSIASEEAFGSVVVEQQEPDIAIVMPSIDSTEEFGMPSLILGAEPIYLPPPDPNAEPGAGGWELWTSGTPAYISRNGFECFITGLWYPGMSTYISYGRIRNPVGPKLHVPKNDSRRASTGVYLDDPIVSHIRPFSRMLRVHYRGRLVYWGVINLPEYDLESNTVQLNSVDPSIRLHRHFLRYGDLENKTWIGAPEPGGLGADGKGMVYVSQAGLRLLRDAGLNLEEQTARGVPDLGIVNGYDDWHTEPGDADGYPDWIEVTRGDRVLDKMKDLSNQLTGPDFEFEPVSGQPGAYCRLNTYYKQGADKTGSVAFHYGTGLDNLENVEVSYGEEFVTHVHTVDRGAKYRYTEANVTASEEHGIYVWWDATDFDVAKLTPAMREKVLRAHGQGILDVYGRPLEAYTLHCRVETDSSPWYMRDYAIGDIIKIAGVKNNFRFEDEVRINNIDLEQVDDAGNIRPTLEVSPTIPTIDVVQSDDDIPPIIDVGQPVITDPDESPPPPVDYDGVFNTLILDEQFNGESLDTSKWSPYNSAGHAGNGLRDPAAFSVVDGQLVITAWWDGNNIHSGGMAHRGSYTYFRAEVRIRTEYDPTNQLSGLALTWPDSNRWPQDGENDWYETGRNATVNRNPFYSYIHHPHDPGPVQQDQFVHNLNGTDWHTMTMEVAADHLTVWTDGVVSGHLTDPSKWAHVPHHVCLQLDAFSNNPLQGVVRQYVDYCKVWI